MIIHESKSGRNPIPELSQAEAALCDFREATVGLRDILARQPKNWGRQAMVTLLKLMRSVHDPENGVQSDAHSFLSRFLPKVHDALRQHEAPWKAQGTPQTKEQCIQGALDAIHSVSLNLEGDMRLYRSAARPHHFTIDELICGSDRLRREGDTLYVKSFRDNKEHAFPIPQAEGLAHKGGFPRVLLKILACAPPETIEAELPPNDLDVVVVENDVEAHAECRALGIEKEGIEPVATLNLDSLLGDRDIDLNGCLFTREGLFFSRAAFHAANTGKIHKLLSERGLYGSEYFMHQGVALCKDRGLCRLIKSVVEGKALAFEIPPRNLQVPLGVYWLVLARRFAEKPQGEQLLERLYEVGKQLGQVDQDEPDIYAVLRRVHAEHPYFTFEDRGLDEVGAVRWLGGKLYKQFDRLFRQLVPQPARNDILVTPGDDLPIEIGLPPVNAAYHPSGGHSARWAEFLKNAQEVNREFRAVKDGGQPHAKVSAK